MSLFAIDATGRIVAVVRPAPWTQQQYNGFIRGDVPQGATHYRNGEFLTQPEKPSSAHTWNEAGFAWVIDINLAWAAVRTQRLKLLNDGVDKINAVRWLAMSTADQAAWTDYRQALLDITSQPDPLNIAWPTPPGAGT